MAKMRGALLALSLHHPRLRHFQVQLLEASHRCCASVSLDSDCRMWLQLTVSIRHDFAISIYDLAGWSCSHDVGQDQVQNRQADFIGQTVVPDDLLPEISFSLR
jgi:hypothetical protein